MRSATGLSVSPLSSADAPEMKRLIGVTGQPAHTPIPDTVARRVASLTSPFYTAFCHDVNMRPVSVIFRSPAGPWYPNSPKR